VRTNRPDAGAADANAETCFPLRQQPWGGKADFPEPVNQPRRFWQLLTIFAVLKFGDRNIALWAILPGTGHTPNFNR
jgi:hypothetical protein